MAITHDEPRPDLGDTEPQGPPGSVPAPAELPPAEANGAGASLLTLTGPGRALVPHQPRDWLWPGADEFFRRIYGRTGGARSEVLAVCSALPGEGKTTVALGIGLTVAEDFPERRVLVVETDLQKPVLAADFALEPAPGLVDCLINEDPIELAYRPTLLDNLFLVPAGGPVPNPRRWLRSSSMALTVDMMRTTHDLVILDVPALLGNSDALLLTDLADGVLLVVRSGVTPTNLVSKALEDVDEGRLRGLVLNEGRSAIPGWLRRLLGLL
jgi:Mrp family chromosome partitioning ATPase